LISLEYLPCFYRLFAPGFDEDRGGTGTAAGPTRLPLGAISMPARGILDRLRTHSRQTTAQLRLYAYYGERTMRKATFEKAIAELQQKFLVVRTEARYDPKFTYIWDLFERQYAEAARAARRLTRQRTLDRILEKYFAVVRYASAADVRSLFGLHSVETNAALARLAAAQRISGPVRFPARSGAWWLSTTPPPARSGAANQAA
jgi:hypothetical protein